MPTGSHGAQFPERETVERDFALMREAGVNTVRVFTVPPVWLLDARRRGRAEGAGRAALVAARRVSRQRGDPDRDPRRGDGRSARLRAVTAAVFAYLVGNEIPPDMVRWHGADAVREFLRELVALVKRRASRGAGQLRQLPVDRIPRRSISPISSASTSICTTRRAFRRYIARLHNLAVDKPLVLTEFGVDSMRNGEDEQAQILSWQVHAAFESGVAGTFVFAWTDEWFTGGHLIEDWAFGLVDRDRQPKPAFHEVARQYNGPLPPPLPRYPRVSVVVCAYNAERTMEAVPRLARGAQLSRLRGHRRQ